MGLRPKVSWFQGFRRCRVVRSSSGNSKGGGGASLSTAVTPNTRGSDEPPIGPSTVDAYATTRLKVIMRSVLIP